MVIVVLGAGMSHAGERFARRTVEGVEERPGVFSVEMPSKLLGAVDAQGDLIVRQGNDFATGELELGADGGKRERERDCYGGGREFGELSPLRHLRSNAQLDRRFQANLLSTLR